MSLHISSNQLNNRESQKEELQVSLLIILILVI